MKPRICICCGERMTRIAKASLLNPHNPHVCGACHVIVLGSEETRPARNAKSKAPKADSKMILPVFPASPDFSLS
jgi:hypothetical protein